MYVHVRHPSVDIAQRNLDIECAALVLTHYHVYCIRASYINLIRCTVQGLQINWPVDSLKQQSPNFKYVIL